MEIIHFKKITELIFFFLFYLQFLGESNTIHPFQLQTNAAARKQCKNKKEASIPESVSLPTLISQISFPQSAQSQDIIRKQFGGGKKNDHKKQESLMQSGF